MLPGNPGLWTRSASLRRPYTHVSCGLEGAIEAFPSPKGMKEGNPASHRVRRTPCAGLTTNQDSWD